MYVQQLYTNCLSEAAYYVESNGKAAIIDPIRDIDIYLQLAKERGATIEYIFETHFHADFISGHLDLSEKTGAPIIYGPGAITSFKKINAQDGQVFTLGNITLTALHTPGHTLESTCFLLKNQEGIDYCIFTGDTLFVGDVGRPDLFGATLSKEDLAALMYNSLQEKIMPLADNVIVYPAHGPGSSCGKNLGPETFSTIGEQKLNNYALQAQEQSAFVQEVTTGLNAPPAYFPLNAKINKEGYDSIYLVIEQSLKPLTVAEFNKEREADIILLDTRKATDFTEGYIPGAIFIGLEGRFAEWAGTILPNNKPILLVTEPGKELESITRLARVGYDNVIGYLDGGYQAWVAANLQSDMIINVEADELAMDIKFDDRLLIVDVRKEAEYQTGHIEGAILSPLQNFTDPAALSNYEETDNLYVHCAGGYRSVIACSIMKKEGIHNLRNIEGGWGKIKEVAELTIITPSPTLN